MKNRIKSMMPNGITGLERVNGMAVVVALTKIAEMNGVTATFSCSIRAQQPNSAVQYVPNSQIQLFNTCPTATFSCTISVHSL
jgi:hypothetical protein